MSTDTPQSAKLPSAGPAVSDRTTIELVGASGEHCVLDAEGHCITCSDEATPARVLHIDEAKAIALVEMAGRSSDVDISLVDDVAPGSWLLVHGGVAIGTLEARSSPEEAHDEQR